jgi:membrane-associated phospholipid phosphatase
MTQQYTYLRLQQLLRSQRSSLAQVLLSISKKADTLPTRVKAKRPKSDTRYFLRNQNKELRNHLQNQRTLLFVCLLFLASFLLVAQLKSSFITIDLQTNSWATSIQTGPLTAVAIVIAYIFDTMGGDALIVSIRKTLVHSPRPLNGLFYDTGFSFPSGHTTASIVFCGLLTYLAWQHWKSPKAKKVSTVLSVATISIVAFDRIYLNVHWFSDVVGGCLLGLFWLTFTLWVFRYVEETDKFQGSKFWAKPTFVSATLADKTRVERRFMLLQVFFLLIKSTASTIMNTTATAMIK